MHQTNKSFHQTTSINKILSSNHLDNTIIIVPTKNAITNKKIFLLQNCINHTSAIPYYYNKNTYFACGMYFFSKKQKQTQTHTHTIAEINDSLLNS